ncbi:Tyrosine-protein kinase YwqD [Neomoorella glycerini]|uniref:non-specific protein-tyrosine kinase n=1 Tax=Neomoorella glycerini TaxID=55779 RepID=A0A6I5ZSX8_9FIRM|nr:CpsD/CapB family tyrosine-protein kinase [Moorella glycerini]QGP92647.1 Tyrosine-protein kinase YwqD [Moorella glycerini]
MAKISKPMLVAGKHPKSPMAEAYRTLRTNLSFAAVDQPVRTLLVTSAGPGEGKSTTISNLAVVLAQGGSQVLLVDCDLRRPSQHKAFELDNSRGLTNALVEEINPEELIQATSVEGLGVLTTGPLPPNPAELLGSERMKGLLSGLAAGFDYVLLDTPPALAVTDAAVLAQQVDGALLVARAGVTRTDMLLEARELLARTGVRLLGAILNGIQPNGNSYYYYYYYYSDSAGQDETLD